MEITPEREEVLKEVEGKLKTSFLNRGLLNQALTHSSYAHTFGGGDNERLEFLGDAVLKLAISEHIYHKFPERAEGDLTKIRASVISDETLSQMAHRIDLGKYLLLSPNERRSGGQKRKSNLANAFEAVIGATYLDAGIGKSREFITCFLEAEIIKVSREGFIQDYKSVLQEFTQKQKWALPQYKVVRETGPKHKRMFWIAVKVKGRKCGVGRGGTKKEAEQKAAAMALRNLRPKRKPAK